MSKEEKELYERICEEFGTNWIEGIVYVKIDGIKYSYEKEEKLDVILEGKYENVRTIYAIGILDEERGYGIKEPLFYIRQDFTRIGSYFSGWYIDYKTPYLVEKKEVTETKWVAV